MHYFARNSVTKHHILGSLDNANHFSLGSEAWKAQIEESAGLVSPEPLSLVFTSAFSLCVFMESSLCACLCLLPFFRRERWSYWIRAHAKDLILTLLPL